MLFDHINAKHKSKYLIWLLAGIGIAERLFQYFVNRSLWVDEAALASNILNRSYSELLEPLNYIQCAPIGFLMTEKFFVELIGKNEYALRLFPLICGIFSIFLFIPICKNILSEKAAIIAVSLFAISKHLIYFSTEAKQYSCEAMFALIMLAITFHIISHGFSKSNLSLLAVAGAVSLWFSFPAVFVLGGIGFGLSFMYLNQKNIKKIYLLIPVFSLWAVSFAANYIFILSKFPHGSAQVDSFQDQLNAFMPFPPTSFKELMWLPKAFELFVRNPCSFSSITIVITIISIAGLISFFKSRKQIAIILLLPGILGLIASALRIYPFTSRLLLYLAPSFLILTAEGIRYIFDKIWESSKTISICIIALVFYSISGSFLVKPIYREEFRSTLSYLQQNYQQGDAIYFHKFCQKFLDCYHHSFDWLNQTDYVVGKMGIDYIESFEEEAKAFDGKNNAWFIFCHMTASREIDHENFSLYHLDKIGTQKKKLQLEGASIYLYDLSK